jgi:5-methylthioribose kinase
MSDASDDSLAVAFTDATLKAYIAATPPLAKHFPGMLGALQVTEIGDGNLNFVFFVGGTEAALAIKQALPYSRMSGGSRALTCERLGFETRALQAFAKLAPELVPAVHHYDAERSLMAQTFLSPHIILRKGMIAGTSYPRLADDISTYLARCLFGTSDLALPPSTKREMVADFAGNIELCEITERLVFTQPFNHSDNNRYSAELQDAVTALQADARLQMRVRDLKHRFLSRTDALLHGDLHTGSIMLTPESTKVIDPEFASFGPMGFDIGMLLANLMLSYHAQPAYPGDRRDYQKEILLMVEEIWTGFATKFRALALEPTGMGVLAAPNFDGVAGFAEMRVAAIDAYIDDVLQDSVGYAGVEMIRRTIGVAHTLDYDEIVDARQREICERAVLDHAVSLLTRRDRIRSIQDMTRI